MKFFGPVLLLVLLTPAWSLGGEQEQSDPYSIKLVQSALKLQAKGVVASAVQKNLQRLGDQISIAILKIFTDIDLADPRTIESFLPIIRISFSEPQLISVQEDKKPKVTVFLLKHLRNEVSDERVKAKIDETLKFVREKS